MTTTTDNRYFKYLLLSNASTHGYQVVTAPSLARAYYQLAFKHGEEDTVYDLTEIELGEARTLSNIY